MIIAGEKISTRKIYSNTTNLYEILVHAMIISLDPFYPAKH